MSTDAPSSPATDPTAPGDAPPRTSGLPSVERYLAAEQTPEFTALRAALRNFVFPMTVAFLAWYALYVVLSAYARGFMGTQVVGNINVALVFGLLQFVTTFLIAWLYARYANRRLDPVAQRIREQVENGATR